MPQLKGVMMQIRRIASTVLLAAALPAACTPSPAQRQTLEDGFTKYSARQFDASEAIASDYIQKNPAVDNVDEAFYLRGLARYSRGNKSAAADDLNAAIAKSKRSDLREKAYRTLGDISFDASKWDAALQQYQKSADAAPAARADPHVVYRIGACLQNMGQWNNARPYFQSLASANGDLQVTQRAVARMNARNFALQFGAFQEGAKAAELIKQLKTAGINATAASELRDGQLLYLVRSGSYNTWEQADAARNKMIPKYPVVTIVP